MDRKAQYRLVAATADSEPIGGHRVSNRVGTGRELYFRGGVEFECSIRACSHLTWW